MNTLTFILALALASVYAAPSNDEVLDRQPITNGTVETKFNSTRYLLEANELKCLGGNDGAVTFTINSLTKGRPLLFPVIDSDSTAKVEAIGSDNKLTAAVSWKSSDQDFKNANATEAKKEANEFKKITYSLTTAGHTTKKFSAEVLLPKRTSDKKEYDEFKISVDYTCATIGANGVLPANQVITFKSNAARYIPGIAVAAMSAVFYTML